MTIGSSLFLIVVGAILRFAVTWNIAGLSLPTVGLILMAAGAVGMAIGLVWMFQPRGRSHRRTLGDADHHLPYGAPYDTRAYDTRSYGPTSPDDHGYDSRTYDSGTFGGSPAEPIPPYDDR